MPQNLLTIPHILPLTFRPITPVEIAAIVSKHPDRYLYKDTIKPWQQPALYCQPFQTTESINLQLLSKVPLFLNVYNRYEVRVQAVPFTQKQRDRYDPTQFIWEISYPLNALQPGHYYFQLGVGSGNSELYISEPIDLQTLHENTLLFEYGHSDYRQGVYFNTGIVMQLRLHAFLRSEPASVSTVYYDQPMNAVILDDVPYEVTTLNVGGTRGIPDSMGKKLNRLLGCDFLTLDGIEYTKSKEAKLEKTPYERYPMATYEIELMESLNRDGNIYIDDVQTNTRIVVAASVEAKGFGQDNQSGIVIISNVE